MRFAVSLFVIAVGAILAFGVTESPAGVKIQVIGLVLILVGLAGLAIARWLFVTRRRTDIIYRGDGLTWLEPNSPPLPERHTPRPHLPDPPAGRAAGHPRPEHGVMDVEPGSEEFMRMGLLED